MNLYWDGTIPGESFHPRTAGLQSSNSVLGWNNNWIVLLSWDRTTPTESFYSGGTTPGEPFCPGMERLQGSHSVLG